MKDDSQTLSQVLGAIRAGYTALSPQFRLAARFLVDHPQDVAVSSMRTIAQRAGVQPATMVRLAKTLGYSGWPALRQKFIDQVRGTPNPFSERAQDLVRRGNRKALFGETFNTIIASVQATRDATPDQAARAVVNALHTAETIYVAGFRSCFAPAFSFFYACRLFRHSVVLLEGTGATFETELRSLTRKDAALLIGFAPYSRESAVAAEAAHSAGARIIAVTDSALSPLAERADHVLLFSTQSPSFFPSVVAASALLESIAAALLAHAGRGAVAGVRAAEAQLFQLGAYLQEPQEHR